MPIAISAKIWGVSFGVDDVSCRSVMLGSAESGKVRLISREIIVSWDLGITIMHGVQPLRAPYI